MIPIEIVPIGKVHSCFTEKFGIPRQPGLVTASTAQIELVPPYNRRELVQGLEEFSHIWVHFQFHGVVDEGWRESVRPPGLGGKKRVGVLATRSPHRPNNLGMSVVRLHGVRSEKGKLFLDISGIDLLHGTPVIDIKPYVAYSDSLPEARSSYAGTFHPVQVQIRSEAKMACERYQKQTGRALETLILEVLAQDPRPASQKGVRDEFGILLWDMNIRFRVIEGDVETLEVFSVSNH